MDEIRHLAEVTVAGVNRFLLKRGTGGSGATTPTRAEAATQPLAPTTGRLSLTQLDAGC